MKKVLIRIATLIWFAMAPAMMLGIAVFVNIGDLSRGAALCIGAGYMAVAVVLGLAAAKGENK